MISPILKQEMIDELVSISLNSSQWNSLARTYNINPSDIYSENSTNPQKAEMLVEKLCQLEQQDNLIVSAKTLIKQRDEVYPSLVENLSSLDSKVAIKFGNLYSELLQKIEAKKTDSIENEDDEEESDNHRRIIDFRDKLGNKARFSVSNLELAIEKRNENSVLRRKAQKLGFDKYEEITKRIRHIYNNRILPIYPPGVWNADRRLAIILNELFEYLPIKYQDDDEAEDYLYGMIFETAFQCFIFNE